MSGDNKKLCERCQKDFIVEEEREKFFDECLKEWNNLKETLCVKCAIEAIEACEDGVYYEFCESCGKEFDYTDKYKFENQHPDDEGILDFTEKILCLDCLEQEYENWCDEQRKIERELGIENDEKPYKECPECGGVMYLNEVWKCTNCLNEVDGGEDDSDGYILQ